MVCLPGCDGLQQGFCKFVGHKIPCYLLIITFEVAAGINYSATISGGVREKFYHWLLGILIIHVNILLMFVNILPYHQIIQRVNFLANILHGRVPTCGDHNAGMLFLHTYFPFFLFGASPCFLS